eukprot:3846522-Rhodomonas_salina.1
MSGPDGVHGVHTMSSVVVASSGTSLGKHQYRTLVFVTRTRPLLSGAMLLSLCPAVCGTEIGSRDDGQAEAARKFADAEVGSYAYASTLCGTDIAYARSGLRACIRDVRY